MKISDPNMLASKTHQKTIFILDQGLHGIGGHYFEYVRSLSEAALRNNWRCVIGCSNNSDPIKMGASTVHPIYSHGVWGVIPQEQYQSDRNIQSVSASFFNETLRLFEKYEPQAGDVVFMPNIASAHIMAAAQLALEYSRRCVRLYFMFRYPSHFFRSGKAAEAFRLLEQVAPSSSIHLCTDSHRLAAELSFLTHLPFEVVPIPHTDHVHEMAASEKQAHKPLQFVSLGNARGEKGISEIFEAIRLSGNQEWGKSVHFTIQVNDPYEDGGAIASFLQNPDPRVSLIKKALDSEDYYRVLNQSDVVLTPYHRDVYGERTSGVFTEGLLAGKVLICTEDTWMSDLLSFHGGGIAVKDRSAADLCRAMEAIVVHKSAFAESAKIAAAYWRKIHNPENLLAHLIGEGGVPVAMPQYSRAVVFFPWGDVVAGKSGASQRLHHLVRFLEANRFAVRILFTAPSEAGGIIGNRSFAEPYRFMRLRAKLLLKIIQLICRALGGGQAKGYHLWFHIWPFLDGQFHRKCLDAIDGVDVIFVEYSYFVPVLRKLLRRSGKEVQIVLTQYDILSDQSKGVPFIHWATKKLEFNGLRSADRVISVSRSDQDCLRQGGIASELIPHPIDIDTCTPVFTRDISNLLLSAICGFDVASKKICFFVGSNYEPNKEAASFVRAFADEIVERDLGSEIQFIVAGACMTPTKSKNFMALGIVENALLSALYDRADLVLIPLREGTGSSVKSIEALANGALILSTSIGMRGVSVESGVQCEIEDDFAKYPDRIVRLLRIGADNENMRLSAAELGCKYDYRSLFGSYIQNSTSGPEIRGETTSHQINRRKSAAVELIPRLRSLPNTKLKRVLFEALDISLEYPV